MPAQLSRLLALAALAIAGGAAMRYAGRRRVHANVFVPTPMGAARPSDVGLAYEALTIPLAGRTLRAWLVPAPQARAAVLFFHGNHDSLASLVPALERLRGQGYSVLAFNYTGHGESTGRPTVERVRADCAAAYACCRERLPGLPLVALGYSLGAAVLLDALHHQALDVAAVVLASPFSSIRGLALREGLPRRLAWLVPDLYNNVRAIRQVRRPVLIVHSESDGTFPSAMARELQSAQPAAQLALVAEPAHQEVRASRDAIGARGDAYWEAIFRFLATVAR
jgi:fermentation-respiration switch protein FrsA (DUF1100 family)